MKEYWKSVNGYENKYEVSNTGKLRSLNYNNTHTIKELKPKINKQGYLEISLSLNNKKRDYILSRLIFTTFTGITLCKNDIIIYKDGNPLNTSLDNLCVITRGQKQEHTYDIGNRERYIFEYNGKLRPIKEIAKINNITEELIRARLKLGWCIYECAEITKGEVIK